MRFFLRKALILAMVSFLTTIPSFAAVVYDFNGDQKAEMVVYRPSNREWYFTDLNGAFWSTDLGSAFGGTRLAAGDYDGDGKFDVGIVAHNFNNPGVHTCAYESSSGGGVFELQCANVADAAPRSANGLQDSFVFTGYNSSTGTLDWYKIDPSWITASVEHTNFGVNNDFPISFADFDRDGLDDIAVFRASEGMWYIIGSRDGYFTRHFGQAGDVPVAADWDGDGQTDFAVRREVNSQAYWYISKSSWGGYMFTEQFGKAAYTPAPADYDGDGITDLADYDGGKFRIRKSSDGQTVSVTFGGSPGDFAAINSLFERTIH